MQKILHSCFNVRGITENGINGELWYKSKAVAKQSAASVLACLMENSSANENQFSQFTGSARTTSRNNFSAMQ
ncbi:hypothetical protein T4E_6267 [Trichinella pseudospiralis]|uniref:Uncharacterized protein n=1 Tax=Trichinella pseudospiralis TaxID=6337 RepID=A0A0V0XD60_TRIPS|nr:hypothetical protein T4E_6267 [Trichinella pseudospiralis]